MSISNNHSPRSKAARMRNPPSLALRKQIEFELAAYCKSETRGFNSWYELDNWLVTKDKNNSSAKGN